MFDDATEKVGDRGNLSLVWMKLRCPILALHPSDVDGGLRHDAHQQRPKCKYIPETHDYQHHHAVPAASFRNRYLDFRKDFATQE